MKNAFLSPLFCLLLVSGLISGLKGQGGMVLWTDIEDSSLKNHPDRVIIPIKYRTLQLSIDALSSIISNAPPELIKGSPLKDVHLDLPMPDGSYSTFRIFESPIMASALAAKYPGIKTFAGQDIANKSAILRFDLTAKGFHAMILSPEGTVFIDPFHRTTTDTYISYYKKDFESHKSFVCVLEDDMPGDPGAFLSKDGDISVGSELRTYRLVVGTSGEYTTYHGGTVMDGLSAVVVTMNRVNGIYERDFSVRMELVADNDLVIFTDPSADPFDPGTNLVNNHNNLVAIIGNENFDIGHVFHLGGGGVASLASVCSENRKGRGYTSGNPPEADPFDIDYVAHEMGHQFAGNHTFNYCQGGQGPVPTEPGSATTIMGYAGICGPDNIASNSNDHFHGVNFEETYNFIVNGGGNSCATITTTGNTPPAADSGVDGYVIPILTPFELEGSASDPDGDSLTYCWESMNMGPASPPESPVGATAIFRSFPPSNSPLRVFPQISDVVNNLQTIGEKLPAYTRPLDFRMTVRDNHLGGGGVHFDNYQLIVTENAGPFLVLEPNNAMIWEVGSFKLVRWDIAGTNQMPVNCQNVDIFLSVDGGYTYPFTLATGLPNSGNAVVTVPDTVGTQNRIKIKAADNVFFDISNQDFSIVNPLAPGFSILASPEAIAVCVPEEPVVDLYFGQLLGFSEAINLSVTGIPQGANAIFSQASVSLPGSVSLTIINTAAVMSGQYTLTVLAEGITVSQTVDLVLTISNDVPGVVNLLSPFDGALDVSRVPGLLWEAEINATRYDIQIAEDLDFTAVIWDVSDLPELTYEPPSGLLQGNTTYFWRIKGANDSCGEGGWSVPFSFRTDQVNCMHYTSIEVPKTINAAGMPIIISRIPVFNTFSIADINLTGLQGTHGRVGDLEFILKAPTGEEVELIPQICGNEINFKLNLDDDSANALDCPFNDGRNYQPNGALSDLIGLNSTGFWTLIIEDHEDGEGGILEAWNLVMCEQDLVPVNNVLSPTESVLLFPNPAHKVIDVRVSSDRNRRLSLLVTDVLGRTFFTKHSIELFSGNDNEFQLDIRDMANGIYFFQLLQENGHVFYNETLIISK